MPHSFAVKCSTPVTHSSVKNNLGHKKIHVCVYIYINYIYIYNYTSLYIHTYTYT